jgi:hypothetical protein
MFSNRAQQFYSYQFRIQDVPLSVGGVDIPAGVLLIFWVVCISGLSF